jgi:biopolymer transport protein ExbB
MAAMALMEVIRSGGPVMYPLLLCSLLVVAIIVERAINLRASKVLTPTTVERVSGLVEGGRIDRAIEVCRENPGMFSSIVLPALETADRGEAAAKEAVEDAGRHETARLSRYMTALGTIAAVAPLLGLFGTVTGMIEVFRTIAQSGVGQAAELSGGISQALVTTAFGLLVAIPALVGYNYFTSRVDSMVTELERESLRVVRGLYSDHGADSPAVERPAVVKD